MARCSNVRTALIHVIIRHIFLYARELRLSAVDAARSMMMGDSITSASGNTMPLYAAMCTSGSAKRATTALSSGSSAPMRSQLAARGSHVRKIRV